MAAYGVLDTGKVTSMHYFQFNIGDYASATAHLEPLEDLIYRRLLDLYYSTEKPICDDLHKVARIIRMRTHSDFIASVLDEFFVLESDGWHCDRVDVEIFKYSEKSVKASRSAKVRWKKVKQKQKDKEVSERNANVSKTHSDGNTNQEPLTKNQEPLTSLVIKDKVVKSDKSNVDHIEIFEHWKSVMGKGNNSVLNDKRTKAIAARLKEGYTVEQIKTAITGCSMTPHNMGQNDNGKKYDELELICRDGSQVERFASNTNNVAKKDINSIATDFSSPEDWNHG